jgi:hypothetical protein
LFESDGMAVRVLVLGVVSPDIARVRILDGEQTGAESLADSRGELQDPQEP